MKCIDVAMGNIKADLVLKNATYLDVFNKHFSKGDIAIADGKIIGIGNYNGIKEIDVKGKYVVPSFIDSYVHIESSKLTPTEFAKLLLIHGVTTIIADPHEIVNVTGLNGIEYICNSAKVLPLDIKIMLPSCVPSTNFEHAGASLDSKITDKLLQDDRIYGLAEFMNNVGVIFNDKEVIAKIESANKKGKMIDGHAPQLTGNGLNAYLSAGVKTDHECVSPEECLEKVSKGMYVALREGSQTKNMLGNMSAVNESNYHRFTLCTDDKTSEDLLKDGSIDYSVKKLVKNGFDVATALIIASFNGYNSYGIKDKGAIAPSYIADLNILDNLTDCNVVTVIKNGNVIAENGKLKIELPKVSPDKVLNTFNIKDVKKEDIAIKIKGNKVRVIGVKAGTIVTSNEVCEVYKNGNEIDLKKSNLLKVCVIERHNATGNIGIGLLKDYGLKNGAIASTVAHDSHNLIVAGDNDEDILLAINEVKKNQGGLTIVNNGKVVCSVPLQIAGLMTTDSAETFIEKYNKLRNVAWKMGVDKEQEPILCLAFLALPVIPELKITDMGLVDVNAFEIVSLEA